MAKKASIKFTDEQIEQLQERVDAFNKANKTNYAIGIYP